MYLKNHFYTISNTFVKELLRINKAWQLCLIPTKERKIYRNLTGVLCRNDLYIFIFLTFFIFISCISENKGVEFKKIISYNDLNYFTCVHLNFI